jgi:hypothetical protein
MTEAVSTSTPDFQALVDANPWRSEPSLRWYLIAFGGQDCLGSAREILRLRPEPHRKVAPYRRHEQVSSAGE